MSSWTSIIAISSAIGVASGLVFRRLSVAALLGGAIPWLWMFGYLLYNEYYVPYQGGGASMWPIALLVGGSAAAAIGAIVAQITWFLRNGLGVSPRRNVK